ARRRPRGTPGAGAGPGTADARAGRTHRSSGGAGLVTAPHGRGRAECALCRGIGGAARRGLQGPLPAGGIAALTRGAAVPLLAPPAPALSAVPVLHGRNRCHKESGRVALGGDPQGDPARLSPARVWDSSTGRPAGPPLHHPVFVRYAAFSR